MVPPTSVKVRIRIDAAADGRFNMDTDRDLLHEAENAEFPFTCFRLYGWRSPTVSLGHNQDPSTALDEAFCVRTGIEWLHRPTGGRAVYHDRELTYAVISNDQQLFPVGSISDTYRIIGEILKRGLARIGVETTMEKHFARASTGESTPPACFASSSRYELLSRGRKLVGSAQRVLRRSFLQHGSIPLSLDYATAARALRSRAADLEAAAISLEEVMPSSWDPRLLEAEMAHEFWTGCLKRRIQDAQRRRPMSP